MQYRKYSSALMLTLALSACPLEGHTQSDPNEMALANRQSVMTLVGQNFGPMGAMMKGDIPWNDQQFLRWAQDLAAVTSLDIMRGFRPGSGVGKTRAKPAVWDNMEVFREKMEEMSNDAAALALAAEGGDKQAIGAAFQELGGDCKGCHDDYKSKDYLNQ